MATRTMDKGQAAQSLEAALGGRKTRQLSTAFPAIWAPEEAGEFVIAAYQGSQEITPKGMGTFSTYSLRLETWNAHFLRSKNAYVPSVDEIISVSGEVLGAALAELKVGTLVAIKYLGLGEKKGKRSAPKLFEVNEVQ